MQKEFLFNNSRKQNKYENNLIRRQQKSESINKFSATYIFHSHFLLFIL